MANPRQKRLMQEALDDSLSFESRQALFEELDQTPEEAEVFTRLKQVDRLLRTAPMERAPERLALKIMARLAAGLQSQALSKTAGMALALALTLLTLLLMPLLAAIGWVVLNTLSSAAALSQVLEVLSGLLITLTRGLETLVASAQQSLQQAPQTSTALLALIPIGIAWLARYIGQERASAQPDAQE